MRLRCIFPVKWKHNRWKSFLKLYSTQQPRIISTNISINQFIKSGRLDIARNLFNEMPSRTVVSWNTMISGYTKWWKFNESIDLLSTMHRSDIRFNESTFSTALSVCGRLRSLTDGKQIHCVVIKSGCESFELVRSSLLYFYANCFEIKEGERVFNELHDKNELLWTLMIVGYVECSLMNEALDLFMKMPKRDVVAWTALISGYVKSEEGCEKALELFWWMRCSGEVVPNEFTLDSVIRACSRLGDLCKGKLVHGILIKYGFEFNQSIGGALTEFYSDCEAIDDAKRVYNAITSPCLKPSNSLIGRLISMGKIEDAELIFNKLVEANSFSYNLMIKGYAACGRVEDSKRLFEEMSRRTIVSTNIMISVYSRSGEIDKALKLFEETQWERDPVTWNSMMSGCIQNQQYNEALKLYLNMCRFQIERTRSTFSVLFHGCSCQRSLQQGQLLHAHLIKTPFESNVYVGTSLIDMYSKCGSITDAYKSFSSISSPNVAAWTSLINGYAHHGFGSQAILHFEHMLEKGVVPNATTFVGILSACGHAGLVNEGMRLFSSMEKCYGVVPTLEHYACIVDLLGRAGHLQEAEEFIKKMPVEADEVVWGVLLNSCWLWMNMEVGERVAEKMFSLNPKTMYAYVILSNIYGVLGKWEEKMNVRKRLRDLEVKKDPACSWIELDDRLFVFSVEDRSHPYCNMIYATLQHLATNLNSFHFDLF
ncbi:pentatricopeptide repeat-containing protein At2g13600-like [Durio zibethinus]|uniref:Pentatricopeptide repeat-containing protein At2g13600-like n=1 Tax=Durio zibethinus TaxID=66656 RepID=A0A6P5Y4K3_DURZI|nr:pentatricopeptide repeat-containing protein At2g13600-like [Durio zibethinus]XP_022735367.1 pentatricopeptide repeat-containing protein At2g13600-like [Durio zibethinus]